MKKNPVVSIVIPCLNRAHFLVPTIESILQQDYPYIECIVKDGVSTDGTIEILKSYGDKIRWVSEPDYSHTDAINRGWWISTGDILAWLNADDKYATHSTVSKAVKYLNDNPDVDVIYGDYAFINEKGEVISEIAQPLEYDLVHAVKYCDHVIPQAASFMRRSILEKVNWLDPEFVNCKDHELWLRIAMVGTIKYAPFFGAYICQGNGLSQRTDVVEGKVNLTKKFFSQPNLPPPFNSKKFKRRALSNAYLAGGIFVWYGSKQFRLFLPSLLYAIIINPWNFPYILEKLSIHVFPYIFPKPVNKFLSFGITCLRMTRSSLRKKHKPSDVIYVVSTPFIFVIKLLSYLIKGMLNSIRVYMVSNLPLPIRKQIRKIRYSLSKEYNPSDIIYLAIKPFIYAKNLLIYAIKSILNNIRIFLVKNLPLPVRKVIRKIRYSLTKEYNFPDIKYLIIKPFIYTIKMLVLVIKGILYNIRIFLVKNLPLPVRKVIRKIRRKFNW